jgi:putative transposase
MATLNLCHGRSARRCKIALRHCCCQKKQKNGYRWANVAMSGRGRPGDLFQGYFASVAMDRDHLIHAPRYLRLNPAMAHLIERARDWRHASLKAHLASEDDALLTVQPLLDHVSRFADWLDLSRIEEIKLKGFGMKVMIGQSMGSPALFARLEAETGRSLVPRKRGPKAKGSGKEN